jgi:hypothetical protein
MNWKNVIRGLVITGILSYSVLLIGMGGEVPGSCEASPRPHGGWCCTCPELGENCEQTSPSGVYACDGYFCDTTPCWAWTT